MSEDTHDSNNAPVKKIEWTYLAGRGDPFEDLLTAAFSEDRVQQPVYMQLDGDEDTLFYSNVPFTMAEAMEALEAKGGYVADACSDDD